MVREGEEAPETAKRCAAPQKSAARSAGRGLSQSRAEALPSAQPTSKEQHFGVHRTHRQ